MITFTFNLDLRLALGLAFFLGNIVMAAYCYYDYRRSTKKIQAMVLEFKSTIDKFDLTRQEAIDKLAEEIWEKVLSKRSKR